MSKATNKAVKIIRKMILDGEFAPGSHLKEEELAEVCGVSRTPVRDALRALAGEDYVRIIPNHGTFVSEWSGQDIAEIFLLRSMLEAYGARLAAEKATEEHIDTMRKEVERIDKMLSSGKGVDLDIFLAGNKKFHETLREAAGSDRLTKIITRLIAQPVVARTAMSYDRDDLQRSNEHHAELVEAISAKDGEWAHSVMTSHILAAFQVYKRHYSPDQLNTSD
ncbi:MAG: GntR family transcriptional regulator [Proteobacteria bacterium]|nr:GntR family transcriptional regulator [Pseudomonadota bacterium]